MICEDSLEILLERLRDFIHHEYSMNPSPNDITETCEAVVELFPSLASENGAKIVNINIFRILFK